jgi:2'-5' RNA ligase
MAQPSEKKRRLFFALWPGAVVQSQLAAEARRWTRHPVPTGNIHMTLVFLGACSEAQSACYVDAVSGIRCESFELQLDYLGAWPRQGIQWLGCSAIPELLPGLVRDMRSVLRSCGLEPDKRPFVPHVTLSRKEKNPRPKSGVEAVCWTVADFVLVESRSLAAGIQYVILQRWPLLNPA